jgi:Family of unknown function (DUF5677)
MKREESAVDWDGLSRTMARLQAAGETRCSPLLHVVGPIDRLMGRLVARETSPASDRPQDYVACVLGVRAFRLTIASIQLALSGYPDACPNLYRTVWEISIRLVHVSAYPIEGSLGYLLQGAYEELATARVDTSDNGVSSDRARAIVARYEERHAGHEQRALARGLDPAFLRRHHGKLNFREVCRALDIERSYLVNYAWASGYVHEKNWATGEFVSEVEGERLFEAGPVSRAQPEAIADALGMLLFALEFAAVIVGDDGIADEASAMRDRLDRRAKLAIAKQQVSPPM